MIKKKKKKVLSHCIYYFPTGQNPDSVIVHESLANIFLDFVSCVNLNNEGQERKSTHNVKTEELDESSDIDDMVISDVSLNTRMSLPSNWETCESDPASKSNTNLDKKTVFKKKLFQFDGCNISKFDQLSAKTTSWLEALNTAHTLLSLDSLIINGLNDEIQGSAVF